MTCVMCIKAYARKQELGGGFRGAVIANGERIAESEILPTLEAAKVWAQSEAHRLMAARPYRRAHVARRFTGGSYVANIWA